MGGAPGPASWPRLPAPLHFTVYSCCSSCEKTPRCLTPPAMKKILRCFYFVNTLVKKIKAECPDFLNRLITLICVMKSTVTVLVLFCWWGGVTPSVLLRGSYDWQSDQSLINMSSDCPSTSYTPDFILFCKSIFQEGRRETRASVFSPLCPPPPPRAPAPPEPDLSSNINFVLEWIEGGLLFCIGNILDRGVKVLLSSGIILKSFMTKKKMYEWFILILIWSLYFI